MAYTPTLSDLDDGSSGGYQPSMDDIDEIESQQKIAPSIKNIFGALGSLGSPLSTAIPQRAAGVVQGARQVGQGVKQTALQLGEALGLVPKGTAAQYTAATDEQQQAWDNSPAGQDFFARMLKSGISSAPKMAVGLGALPESALARLVTGAAAGAGAEGISYTPQDQSKLQNMATGAAEGAALGVAPEIMQGASSAASLAAKAGKGALGIPRAILKDMEPLAQKEAMTSADADAAKKALDQARLEAKSQTGKSDVGAFIFGKNKMQDEASQLGKTISDFPDGDLTSQHTGNLLNGANERQQNAKDALDQYLGVGEEHDTTAATNIAADQKRIKSAIGDRYKAIEKSLSDKDIQIDNSDEIKAHNDELMRIANEGGIGTKEFNDTSEKIAKAKEDGTINANDYLANYRSVRDMAVNASREAYRPGVDAVRRKELLDTASKLEEKSEQMKEILRQGIGDEDFNNLMSANSDWAKNVIPLYRNPVFSKLSLKNQMSDNIAKSIRGNEAGNVLMQDMIKRNPETLRNVIGQRYAKKPDEVLNPNSTMQSYIDADPKLQSLIEEHQAAESGVQDAKELHESVLSHEKNKERVEELQGNISLFDKHIENLQNKVDRAETTGAQARSAKRDLEEAKRKRYDAIVALGKFGVAPVGAAYSAKKLLNLGDSGDQQ